MQFFVDNHSRKTYPCNVYTVEPQFYIRVVNPPLAVHRDRYSPDNKYAIVTRYLSYNWECKLLFPF